MTETTADDRVLARQVLEEGSETAFAQLLEKYRLRLRERAALYLRRKPGLGRHGDADDLVQEFLVEKFLPPQKRRVMLAPVAEGTRELWPRLCASIDNFLISFLRKKTLPIGDRPVGEGKGEYLPEDRSQEVWPDVIERVAAQLTAVRGLPAATRGAVPYSAVLLLSERLLLAKQVADSYAPEDGRTVGNQSLREMVEVVAAWTPAEETTPLPPQAVELGAAWRMICNHTADRPQLAGPAEVALALGGNAAAWNQWLFRGRVYLVRHLGPAAAQPLLPYWPSGAFERAAQAAREGEP
jgi:DNA-directed RNA polymerase specialized sigma24 family protein